MLSYASISSMILKRHKKIRAVLMQPVFFMYCTFMDRDVYSADAPGSIPTLLTINALTL